VRWDDGSSRIPSTILFFLEASGEMKCCLNDRANNRSCFVTGVSIREIMGTLEFALKNDSADWRSRGKSAYSAEKIPF